MKHGHFFLKFASHGVKSPLPPNTIRDKSENLIIFMALLLSYFLMYNFDNYVLVFLDLAQEKIHGSLFHYTSFFEIVITTAFQLGEFCTKSTGGFCVCWVWHAGYFMACIIQS